MNERLVLLPERPLDPVRGVIRRLAIAMGVLLAVVFIVMIDAEGYRDGDGSDVTVLDAFYYATVTLSTTGYGDITPVSEDARLVNVLVITPLRVLFLIVLVGTTLEVLTQRTREQWVLGRWRSRVRNHTVVIGFGTKGRSAVRALLADGTPPEQLVVIDPDQGRAAEATELGLIAVVGDATRGVVLDQALVGSAGTVLIAPQRDDTAVLVTLAVRQRSKTARIIVTVREAENTEMVRQSGADTVIVSSETAGRLLGLSASNPHTSAVVEDLLVPHSGLEVVERPPSAGELGLFVDDRTEAVLAVIRNERVLLLGSGEAGVLQHGDRLVVVRASAEAATPATSGGPAPSR